MLEALAPGRPRALELHVERSPACSVRSCRTGRRRFPSATSAPNWVGLLLASAGAAGRAGIRQGKVSLSARRAAKKVQLLVDGDSHTIDEVRRAMRLAADGGAVKTLIFAAPGRRQNKKWQELFRTPNVVFRPVGRDGGGDPGDVAIIQAFRKFVRSSLPTIALLVSDND